MTQPRVAVLVAAGGADWETAVLERIAGAGPGTVLLKRCVDLADLLATAATGTAQAGVVSGRLFGLDADSVARLRRLGVGTVAVTDPPEGPSEGAADRVRRWGVDAVVTPAELDRLPDLLRTAAAGAERTVSAPGRDAGDGTDIDEAYAELLRLETDGRPPARGRLVAVWGPMGSPGRTTVAVGLAAEIGARQGAALLLDVDPYGGAVAQHLGLTEEVSGLLAAARLAGGGQLDRVRLAGLARQSGAGLRVLTGLPRPDRWSEVRSQAFTDLLDVARSLDPVVVVDAGPGIDREPPDPFDPAPARHDMTLGAVAEADRLVAVGAADPVGLTKLARGLLDLVEVRPAGADVVVVNRMRPSLGWSERELVSMVDQIAPRAVVRFLPDDRAATDRALVAGRSLVESGDSPLRRAVAGLAADVTGAGTPAPAAAWRVTR